MTYLQPLQVNHKTAEWLWEHVKDQDYSFDDITRNREDMFYRALQMPNTEHFQLGDDGYVVVNNIYPPVVAQIHFAVWNKVRPRQLIIACNQLLYYLFNVRRLHRVSAPVPSFNSKALKFVRIAGFQYEGTIREAFLHHQAYYDILIFGVLGSEFKWKGAVH